MLLIQFYLFNKELLIRLSQPGKQGGENSDIKQEKRAWEQATSASNRYALFEFLELILLVILPVIAYGYFNLQIEGEDILQISLAALAAGLVNLIVGYLVLDQYFKPIVNALLPKKFDTQLSGLKGIRLWVKVSVAIVGVAVISLLLIVPSAYHQMHIIFWDLFRFPQVLESSLLVVVNAGIGAIVVGVFLSLRLASYFTHPFRKMIDLYKKVEGGDLSQRIEVSHTDEFGELNIYLNRMIERLEKLTTSLEQQVIERTEQLSQANEQLQERGIQLRELAVRDSLTGLYNRRYLDVMLEREFSRAERKQLPLGIIMIDIDHFKQYNDTHGHAAGDLLLMHVGETAKGLHPDGRHCLPLWRGRICPRFAGGFAGNHAGAGRKYSHGG